MVRLRGGLLVHAITVGYVMAKADCLFNDFFKGLLE